VLHVGVTLGVLYWLYRRRPWAFPVVRTVLVVTTGLALVGYIAYPVAPPRLAVPGVLDVVSRNSPVDLSSRLLGRFFNPVAAFPSLHFAYALLFGLAVVVVADSRTARAAGAAYPLVALLVIVATGNHFFFDAFSGAAVTLTAAAMTLPFASFPQRVRDTRGQGEAGTSGFAPRRRAPVGGPQRSALRQRGFSCTADP
jgi:hypothetical protein